MGFLTAEPWYIFPWSSSSIHSPDHSLFPLIVFTFAAHGLGGVGSCSAVRGLVRLMQWLQWTVPHLPVPCLLVLALHPARSWCRCVWALCFCMRKCRRFWCYPPSKFTILIMTVNTNFPEGLQKLRTDYTPGVYLTSPVLFHSEEPNLSLTCNFLEDGVVVGVIVGVVE